MHLASTSLLAMMNPVDYSPAEPGKGALLLDPQPATHTTSRLRTFRRRILSGTALCFLLGLVFWCHPLTVGRPNELAQGSVGIAVDPRLEAYQNPENAKYCADWSPAVEARDNVSVTFELPTEADLLFFLSRGPVSGGIDLVRSTSSSTGPVEVNVTATYHDIGDLRRTKVCRMGAADEHGLLIWAEPRHPHGHPTQNVQFTIIVALPIGVQSYKDLTTDLARFAHTTMDFFDWWSPVSFEVIRLRTSDAAIHSGLMGRALFIQTSNADVQGNFAGYELGVQTSNAPIQVAAIMFGENVGSESRVQLKTSNGAIDVDMVLLSGYANNTLRAVVQTSAAPITINRRLANKDPIEPAINSSFFLDASTSLGAASVQLYPEYEGTYDLQTSSAPAEVWEGTKTEDPLGKGRHRTVNKTLDGEHAQGSMFWSRDGEPPEGVRRGAVKIITSKSPIVLFW
ncbi:hypothetical protein DFH07DRAFT_1062464 [Mycena maculata]|uniref:Uncharacterized protein n=1 Tax=Mycena maculata TaxID=230809 RepID=A0AAD7IR50_9AGAR|nr:hypothetical protein DFH07DRAFT_1062464 [Mycena maculata]